MDNHKGGQINSPIIVRMSGLPLPANPGLADAADILIHLFRPDSF